MDWLVGQLMESRETPGAAPFLVNTTDFLTRRAEMLEHQRLQAKIRRRLEMRPQPGMACSKMAMHRTLVDRACVTFIEQCHLPLGLVGCV